ncbi:EAL domain-containing protein [Cryptosporangium minutisporangium]|uniref:EAL domain-containing protein n=1 Tax=Cryptosporangium minutisporangium TaxID=113569 RepID=A0ABP6SRY7_9ACTN
MHAGHAPLPVSAPADVTIRAVIDGRLVQPVFQPIVDLATRRVVGMEALARGPAGTTLEMPDRLFAAARAAGVVGELDLLCSERALECALAAPVTPPLVFVNAEPGVMDQPLSPRLLELLLDGLPFREVLEFTERALPAVPGSLLHIAGLVQQWGHSLALDDVGVDPMSLAFLPVLEPEVIKLDMSLVRNPHSEHTRSVCAVVQSEARRTGAVVIAEGIETDDDLVAARELGAHWGQGWLFGRPGTIEQHSSRFDPLAASVLRAPRPGFYESAGGPFEIAAEHGTVAAATADAVTAALSRLRALVADDTTIVVLASAPDDQIPAVSTLLPELADRARSAILLDDTLDGEFALVVIGAGYGYALGVRSTTTIPELVTVEDIATVAATARALLNRLS